MTQHFVYTFLFYFLATSGAYLLLTLLVQPLAAALVTLAVTSGILAWYANWIKTQFELALTKLKEAMDAV